jgi:putative tricarboxylic transport membrane protein
VFNVHDMEVGPLIMVEAPELVWILFSSMFWASLAILALGMVESKTIVHLLRIPFSLLAPGILVFSMIGAYALRDNIFDVYTMFVAGIAGYFLRRSDYSVPAIVMGVILGKIGENSMAQALTMLDYDFLGFITEPVSGVFIIAGLLTIVISILRRAQKYFGIGGKRGDRA